MRLTQQQSSYLQILGHDLQSVIDVGAGGLTNSTLKAIERALDEHELVKVRVPFGDRRKRGSVLDELAPMSRAALVQRAGNTVLLYRPAHEPVIKLP